MIRVQKSTVSIELRRNRGLKDYQPKQAHQFALNKRKKARYRIEASTWILIETMIHQDWSPEHVSGRIKKKYGVRISSSSFTALISSY